MAICRSKWSVSTLAWAIATARMPCRMPSPYLHSFSVSTCMKLSYKIMAVPTLNHGGFCGATGKYSRHIAVQVGTLLRCMCLLELLAIVKMLCRTLFASLTAWLKRPSKQYLFVAETRHCHSCRAESSQSVEFLENYFFDRGRNLNWAHTNACAG